MVILDFQSDARVNVNSIHYANTLIIWIIFQNFTKNTERSVVYLLNVIFSPRTANSKKKDVHIQNVVLQSEAAVLLIWPDNRDFF